MARASFVLVWRSPTGCIVACATVRHELESLMKFKKALGNGTVEKHEDGQCSVDPLTMSGKDFMAGKMFKRGKPDIRIGMLAADALGAG